MIGPDGVVKIDTLQIARSVRRARDRNDRRTQCPPLTCYQAAPQTPQIDLALPVFTQSTNQARSRIVEIDGCENPNGRSSRGAGWKLAERHPADLFGIGRLMANVVLRRGNLLHCVAEAPDPRDFDFHDIARLHRSRVRRRAS